jgi:hypothetical protein
MLTVHLRGWCRGSGHWRHSSRCARCSCSRTSSHSTWQSRRAPRLLARCGTPDYASCLSARCCCRMQCHHSHSSPQERKRTVWSTFLQAVLHGNLAMALQLLRRAKQQGLQPVDSTYRALLRLCALSGRGRTALRLHKVPHACLTIDAVDSISMAVLGGGSHCV